MNLRLASQSIRARISQEELERLLSGEDLSEWIHLPGNPWLNFGIRLRRDLSTDDSPLALSCQAGETFFRVTRSALSELQERLPSKDHGIFVETPVPGGLPLRLALEVDLKSLERRNPPKPRFSSSVQGGH